MRITFYLSPSSTDASGNNTQETGSGDELSANQNLKSPAEEWREMREEAKERADSSLQSPQEANAKKHINFINSDDTNVSDNDDEQPSAAKQQWKEMREEKLNNNIDPSLQSPQDANTQKHINFLDNDKTE